MAEKKPSLGERIETAKTSDELELLVMRALAHRIVTTVTDPSEHDPSATRQLCESFAAIRGERAEGAGGFSLGEALKQAEQNGERARAAHRASKGNA